VSERERSPQPWTSLLHEQIDTLPGPSGQGDRQPAADFQERERKAYNPELEGAFIPGSHSSSIFAIPPSLATPLVGSYASYPTYGTLPAESSERRSSFARSWIQPVAGEQLIDELPPILVKEVEQDGKIVLTVEGQSTLPQTIFNSIKFVISLALPPISLFSLDN